MLRIATIELKLLIKLKNMNSFNQVKYTVQSGALRKMRAYAYATLTCVQAIATITKKRIYSEGIGSTNEWRIWLDIPVKLF